jgi:predicted dehydrogenase
VPDIRVGLIGFGYAGRTFHAPLIRATDGLRLVAVASSDPAKVHAALGPDVTVSSARELIARADLQLVVVATPNETHRPLAIAALTAGRHVVVDKPFALNVAEATDMIAAAARASRLLTVFHNRRWDSGFLTLKRSLREGRVGRPVEFVAHFDRFRPNVRERWRESGQPGAGLWMDLGPHLIDHAVQLFGPPAAITLVTAMLRDGALSDDWFGATLRWGEGPQSKLLARLHASTVAARPGPHLALHGTEGSFVVEALDSQEDALKNLADRHAIRSPKWGQVDGSGQLFRPVDSAARAVSMPLDNGSYPAFYAELRDALNGAGANPVPAGEALAVQELLDAGLASARERREVLVSPPSRR